MAKIKGLPTLEGVDTEAISEPQFREPPTFEFTTVEETEEVSEFERLKIAIEQTPTGYAVDSLRQPHFTYNPEYNGAEDVEKWQDLPEEYRHNIWYAQSEDEAKFQRNKAIEEEESKQRLLQGGAWSALAYQTAALVLDPSTIAAGVAEIKAITNITGGLAKAGAAASIMGATAAGQEVLRSAGDTQVTGDDVTSAALMGAAMFPLGMFGRSADDIVRHTASESTRVTRNLMEEMAEAIRKEELSVLDDVIPTPAPIDMMGRRRIEAEELLEEFPTVGERPSANRKAIAAEIKDFTDNVPNKFDQTKLGQMMDRLGFSDFMRMYRSKSNAARWFAHNILEDASGQQGRNLSASILFQTERYRLQNIAMRDWKSAYRAFAHEKGIHPLRNFKQYVGKTAQDFNEELYLEMAARHTADDLGEEFVSSSSRIVQDYADLIQKQMDEGLGLLQKSGVNGYSSVVRKAGYLPLVWKGQAIRKIRSLSKGKYNAYKKLLTDSYISMEIDPETAGKIANAVFRRHEFNDAALDTNPTRLFATDNREFITELLHDADVPDTEVDIILERLSRSTEDAGKAKSARRRTSVDLTASTTYQGEELRLIDLVDTNVQGLVSRYTTEASGRAALARKGIRSNADFKAVKDAVLDDARASGVDDAEFKDLGATMDAIEAQLLGKPYKAGINPWARRLMDWASAASLGTVGFAQAAEFAPILASHGVKNTLDMVPRLKSIRKALKAGDLEEAGVLGELNAHLGGLWDEHLLFRSEVRLDEFVRDDAPALHMLDNVLASANNKLGYLSGMNQIKELQHQFVMMMQVDKVMKYLKEGTQEEAILRRFADIGWEPKVLAKFKSKIDKGLVTFQPNGAVDKLNIAQWEPELIESFVTGMHRHTSQLVQKQLLGEGHRWMNETLGAMLTQFRSFPIVAMEKQFKRQVSIGDVETQMAFMYGTALSTAVTLAKAASSDVVNDKERLDKTLSPAGMIQSAMQYNSMWGLFPEVVKGVGSFAGIEPLQGSTKSRGLQFSANSIPALSNPAKLVKGLSGITQAAAPWSDKTLKKSTIRQLYQPIVLSNTLPGLALGSLFETVGED